MSGSPIAFGDYVVTRRIARGGMAEIFRARRVHGAVRAKCSWEDDSAWLALKMMRSELGNHELRERLFRREAKIAEAIQHPNVVPIFEHGECERRHFLAMEYVAGKNLAQLALRGKKKTSQALALDLALYIAKAVSLGLGHAHRLANPDGSAMEIVHRDISPGNIMVAYDGRAKILDFGVARMNETNGIHTQTGTLRGKFAYMSPEQTLGARVDARSDVFAFGTVFYELLTGHNPFRAANPIATLNRVQTHRPVPPSHLVEGLPQALDQLLAKCLAKDPRRRFLDGKEIHDALCEFTLELRQGHSPATRDDMRRFMETHFSVDQIREEALLKTEIEQVAAVEILDFDLADQAAALVEGEINSSELQHAPQAEIIAAVSGLLSHDPETMNYLSARIETPLSDEFETARDTVFDSPRRELPSDTAVAAIGIRPAQKARLPIAVLAVAAMVVFGLLRFDVRPASMKRRVTERHASEIAKPSHAFAPSTSHPNGTAEKTVGLKTEGLTAEAPGQVTMLEPFTISIPVAARQPVRRKIKKAKYARRKSADSSPRKKRARTLPATHKIDAAGAEFGYLNIGAKPWAEIEIDGKLWTDITPQTGIKLEAGIHRIRVRNPDTGVEKNVRVEISSGRYKTLRFDLRVQP